MGKKDIPGQPSQGLGQKLKNAAGIEGKFGTYIKPMAGYTCANITLGGAGYPINLYHQQYLSFVEEMPTDVTINAKVCPPASNPVACSPSQKAISDSVPNIIP